MFFIISRKDAKTYLKSDYGVPNVVVMSVVVSVTSCLGQQSGVDSLKRPFSQKQRTLELPLRGVCACVPPQPHPINHAPLSY